MPDTLSAIRRRVMVAGGAMALAALALGGCGRQERVIAITSEPAGAVVWLNDYELGRTPLETEFTFFGVYDVRLALPGYQTLQTSREAEAPLHEYPGVDLLAAAVPGTRRTRIQWHFDLTRVAENTDPAGAEAALLDRARQMRGEAALQTGGGDGGATPAPTVQGDR